MILMSRHRHHMLTRVLVGLNSCVVGGVKRIGATRVAGLQTTRQMATGVDGSGTNLFLKNDVVVDDMKTPDQLLSLYTGAFSTCRTIGGGNRVVMWENHLKRTLNSMSFVPSPSLREKLVAQTEENVRNALTKFREKEGIEGDLRFTLLYAEEKRKENGEKEGREEGLFCDVTGTCVDVWVGVRELPKLPQRVIVEVREGVREHPEQKTTDWVKERKKFQIYPPVHEIALVDDQGRLYEGGSSNIVVHRLPQQQQHDQGAILRPPKGTVLEGTVLSLLEKVCASPTSSVPFLFSFFSLYEFSQWGGVGITSTSRGLLSVDEVRMTKRVAKKYGLLELVKGEVEEEEAEGEEREDKVLLEVPRSSLLETLSKELNGALLASSCVPGEAGLQERRNCVH